MSDHAPSHVIDHLVTLTVVRGGQVLGSNGQANGIGDTLAKGSSGNFNAFILNFRVAWAK